MADISKITLPTGTTYNLKDTVARESIGALSGAVKYLGVTTTKLMLSFDAVLTRVLLAFSVKPVLPPVI